jgi:hypothetical protein
MFLATYDDNIHIIYVLFFCSNTIRYDLNNGLVLILSTYIWHYNIHYFISTNLFCIIPSQFSKGLFKRFFFTHLSYTKTIMFFLNV